MKSKKMSANNMNDQIQDDVKDLVSGKTNKEKLEKIREHLKDDPIFKEQFKKDYIIWRHLAMRFGRLSFQPANAWLRLKRNNPLKRPQKLIRHLRVAATIAILIAISSILWMVYQKNDATVKEIEYTVVEAPRGSKTRITLPDQSQVWINSDSRLMYANNFKENRHLQLEGEAIFTVTRDSLHPFTVSSGQLEIKVLGTTFVVESYPDEMSLQVTVVEGKVATSINNSATRLTAQQQLRFDKNTGKADVRQVNTNRTAGWDENKFYFNHHTLSEICNKLERAFDIQIEIIPQDLKRQRFYADFTHDETPEDILKILDAEAKWKITCINKNIRIDYSKQTDYK